MLVKSIKKLSDIKGKKVLVRVDYNVPVKDGKVIDDYKIKRELPTLNYLLKKQAKVIVLTHLGRPHPGKHTRADSTEPLARQLGRLLHVNVGFVRDVSGFDAGSAVGRMKNSQVLMLDNVRFAPGEISNGRLFARKLAALADIYVNDAFAMSHRAHASVAAIKGYLPSYAGLLLQDEIKNLEKAIKPKQPLVVVIGGVKLATKLPLLKKFLPRAHRILVGGALANNILAAHGFPIGKSLADPESIILAKRLIKGRYAGKLVVPVDVVLSNRHNRWRTRTDKIRMVGDNDYIFDIGPETVKLYSRLIREAATILWNGPMGRFEEPRFKHGTLAIAQTIAARSTGRAFGVAGGGETVEALKMTKMMEHMDWISTGGGAMLSFLAGEKMPGLSKIT